MRELERHDEKAARAIRTQKQAEALRARAERVEDELRGARKASAGKPEASGDRWIRLGEGTTRRQAMRAARKGDFGPPVGRQVQNAICIALDVNGRWWVGERGTLEGGSSGGHPLRLIAYTTPKKGAKCAFWNQWLTMNRP